MRTRKKKWTAAELSDNPRVLSDPAPHACHMAEYFGNGRPIHVELGCGKGRFITQTASANPAINFAAIERDPNILAAAARISRGLDCSLAFLPLDAKDLASFFNPGEVSRLYINFCDPWPNKKKWAKRRLTHENFLAIYETLRIPEIFFKTDNSLLFGFSVESLSARGWRLANVSVDLHHDRRAFPGDVMTEYEEKFSAKGMPIYRLEAYRGVQLAEASSSAADTACCSMPVVTG